MLNTVQAPESALADSPGMKQRRAIAKAITLLESTRTDHRAQADELLTALQGHAKGAAGLIGRFHHE